jgi:hypothetical protein
MCTVYIRTHSVKAGNRHQNAGDGVDGSSSVELALPASGAHGHATSGGQQQQLHVDHEEEEDEDEEEEERERERERERALEAARLGQLQQKMACALDNVPGTMVVL